MRVLIADDDPQGRYLLEVTLRAEGFEVSSAEDGRQALDAARSDPPDVLITDVLMPHMDGYQLCGAWKADPLLARIPVVFYSAAYTEQADRELASSLGADRFILKPAPADTLAAELRSLGNAHDAGVPLPRSPVPGRETEVLKMYNERLVNKLEQKLAELRESNLRLSRLTEGIVHALAEIVESRDPYTAGHQEHVSELACAIATEMGLPDDICDSIRLGGLLHDLGKVHIPAEILSKPGKLTDVEYALVKTHPEVARDILAHIEFPWPIADFVYQHHERMNGSGYPTGLTGSDIRVEARILAVADVVEAMSMHRPYRPALGIDAALAEIESGRGRLYDADVSNACLALIHDKRFAFA